MRAPLCISVTIIERKSLESWRMISKILAPRLLSVLRGGKINTTWSSFALGYETDVQRR